MTVRDVQHIAGSVPVSGMATGAGWSSTNVGIGKVTITINPAMPQSEPSAVATVRGGDLCAGVAQVKAVTTSTIEIRTFEIVLGSNPSIRPKNLPFDFLASYV